MRIHQKNNPSAPFGTILEDNGLKTQCEAEESKSLRDIMQDMYLCFFELMLCSPNTRNNNIFFLPINHKPHCLSVDIVQKERQHATKKHVQ
jgi:hypothetical protein